MKKTGKDTFSSIGVFLAMVGSAVGLGNIWRFPYMMGENGGGAFILIYLLFAFVLSMPIMISEFVIGRKAQSNAVESFRKLAPGTKWHWTGYLFMVTVIVMISFYAVVGGWSLRYFIKSLDFAFTKPGVDFGEMFSVVVSSTWIPILTVIVYYLINGAIVGLGIKGGIEKFSKFMMPLLFVIMIGIAVFSMMLPGAADGVRYIFIPDFSKVTGKTLIAAMGQAFFSLSVGAGAVITYASYANKNENILKCSTRTVCADTIFAIVAGCAIMPAVFAFGFSPSEGPGLAFITLPAIFSQMKGGAYVAIFLFFALLLAAVSSSISMIEVAVSFFRDRIKTSRVVAIIIVCSLMLSGSILCSLSQGPVLGGLKILGRDLLSLFDYLVASWFMTIGALLTVLFVGWKMGKQTFVDELTNSGEIHLPRWLVLSVFYLIKFVVPVVIIIVAAVSI